MSHNLTMTDLTQAVETAASTYWTAVVMRKLATARPWELVDPITQHTIREELLPVVEAVAEVVREQVLRELLATTDGDGLIHPDIIRRELGEDI